MSNRHNEYMREWRAKNEEKNKLYQREYFKQYYTSEKREEARERARKWYKDNKEYAKKRSNDHYHTTKTLKGRPSGKQHFAWKGDKISYGTLHDWVTYHLGRPNKCTHCRKTGNTFQIQWANISQKYKRDLTDWVRLCSSCHKLYDKGKIKLN